MKRTLVAVGVVLATVFACAAQSATSATAVHLNGGGAASQGATAFSQVAFNVSIDSSGNASGSFECLMAGRSASVLGPFNLAHNMIVHATPATGSVDGSVVTFDGPARLTLDGSTKMSVHVHVWANVATQQFELTVVEVGAMGVETLTSGEISLR